MIVVAVPDAVGVLPGDQAEVQVTPQYAKIFKYDHYKTILRV